MAGGCTVQSCPNSLDPQGELIEPSCHTLGKRIVSMRVKVSSCTPAEGQQGTGDCLLVLQGCKAEALKSSCL